MKMNKLLVAAALAASIAAPIAGFVGELRGQSMTSTGVRVPFLHGFPIGPSASYAELASLTNADEWLNSQPLTPAALRGKVVLVNFWTYTCINWRRQLPYVRAWAEKYKDQGLVVVGVHAPEFEFEKDMAIDYPVAVDNMHAIWRGFGNQAWPALYFIDAQGRVRHHHFGEGSYEQSEMVIQSLLREAGAADVSREPVSVNARGHDAASQSGTSRTGREGDRRRLDHGRLPGGNAGLAARVLVYACSPDQGTRRRPSG